MASSDLGADAPSASIPAPPVPPPTDDGMQIRHVIASGDTFAGILRERGLGETEARAWEKAAASAYDVTRLQPRRTVVLTMTRTGSLTACDYEIDKYALLSLRLVHGQIQARLKAMPQLAAVRGVVGRVESSLATSAAAAGVPAPMVSELADVFGWDVDLQNDVHAGDEFRVVYAELRDVDNGARRPGDILAAEITTGGKTRTAIRFENDKGESEYYDADGHPLGRSFLRYPLDFVSVTSQFSDSRMHPLLKRRVPHLGVDFAAPIGTPVRAVADGVVTFAGYASGYGNQVGIEHEAPYGSSYSHLRRIARGIRLGSEVRKGQVIGYVGRSGLATGPHLHFMLFRDGVYVNPLAAKLPADEKLSGTRLAQFSVVCHELLSRLAALTRPIDVPALSLAPLSPTDVLRSKLVSSID